MRNWKAVTLLVRGAGASARASAGHVSPGRYSPIPFRFSTSAAR